MLTAWGDESGSQPERDPGSYLIAAALIDEDDVSTVRKTMDGLLLSSETKVHWHRRSDDHRSELIAAVAELPVCSLVVVHHDTAASDRRHRRKCLEYLLPHLADMPCASITLESRGPMDQSDLDILQKFRARKLVQGELRIRHERGRVDPVLSVPDVVCGAVVQARVGNHTYLDALGGLVDIRSL
ncbi:hypothetical protein IU421_18330 [Nocardia cyriacigeorgica]|uniref:hypothetical protein n=1 Tax=Nocardia cyriacigeorgica TaxID=135487 RepID=UPI0018938EE5|nr:hypothetical protein [Nocardia cyriacigeorgica]MBF6159974.1 hypothetical protein [Nocardia cyriacigeorgica]MBF6199058.1 hypothetical protein [Nocardia cyriacigeorgica]MBF6343529.1 hypothetical protein [Nocardia cyriacigeorgica]MBF6516212.1 hypothetical protein [Nocardia cyriacigeorgica]